MPEPGEPAALWVQVIVFSRTRGTRGTSRSVCVWFLNAIWIVDLGANSGSGGYRNAVGVGYESGGVAQGHTTARCSVIWSEGLVFGLFLGVFLEEFLLHVAGHELV